jgi:hypothetical protein
MLMTIITFDALQMAFVICRELSHPTSSLSRIVCRGQEGLKGSKGTLGPDFLDVIFKSNVTTIYRKEVVRKSRCS